MQVGLYEAVSGMKAQSAYEDVLSSNLARSSIPGSKQVLTAFELPKPSALQEANALPGTTQNLGVAGAPLQSRTVIDFSPGLVRATGNPTDFAIEGDAFFKVRNKDGSMGYTRDGQFRVNTNGVLVTGDGSEVLMDNDVPLNLSKADAGIINIDPQGVVKVGPQGVSRGSLAIVHMDDPRTVLHQGQGGRFQADTDKTDQLQTGLGKSAFVRQGYLEDSNANPVTSMIQLVEVVRAYEANQRAVTMQDSVTGQIIQAASDNANS
ncbi:MAG: flagellar hook-basal body protein [Verrucomicrobium sp.]|nr:flagellar hook-basal body protein [Verrucomicrobium sp.]